MSNVIQLWTRNCGEAWLALLVDAAVKGTVVLLLAWLATRMLRRAPAATRHLVWLLAMVSLLLLPVLAVTAPIWPVLPGWMSPQTVLPATGGREAEGFSATSGTEAAGSAAATGVERGIAGTTAVGPSAVGAAQTALPTKAAAKDEADQASVSTGGAAGRMLDSAADERALGWDGALVVMVWLAGAAAVLGRTLLGVASLAILGQRGRAASGHGWQELLSEAAGHLGLRRRVVLLESDRRAMPMVWGIARPRLVVPAEALAWSIERRRIVLLHELAHVKRWDCLWQMVVQAACAAYWFHPLVWAVRRWMQTEQERACDDMVLNAGSRPSEYARHLLEIASGLHAGRLAGAAAIAMAKPSRLEGRLLAILDGKRNRRAVTWGAVLAGIVLLGGVVVPVAMLRAGAAAEKKAEDARTAEARDALPQLQFLAWGDNGKDKRKVMQVWGPDGRSLPDTAVPLQMLQNVWHVYSGVGDDARSLTLWFACKGLDLHSFSDIRLLDKSGQAVSLPQWGAATSTTNPFDPKIPGSGFFACRFGPAQEWQLPAVADVELRYSMAEWGAAQEVSADSNSMTTVDSEVYVPTVAQSSDNRAMVMFAHFPGAKSNHQYRVTATTKAGKVLESASASTVGVARVSPMIVRFDVPLSKIKSFQVHSRPIRTVVYKNVSLAAGQETAVEVVEDKTAAGSPTGTQPAAASQSDASPASTGTPAAVLPSGARVELLAVEAAHDPMKPATWLAPSGKQLAEGPVSRFLGPVDVGRSNLQQVGFVVRVADVQLDRANWVWQVVPDMGKPEAGPEFWKQGLRKEMKILQADQGVYGLPALFSRDARRATLRVGIAVGAWQSEFGLQGSGGAAGMGVWAPGYGLAVSAAAQRGDKVLIDISHNVPQYDIRLVVEDFQGGKHLPSSVAQQFSEICQTRVEFDGLTVGQIKSLDVQMREYQWVEFADVSLVPGQKTDVQVTVRSDAKSELVPTGKATFTPGDEEFVGIYADAEDPAEPKCEVVQTARGLSVHEFGGESHPAKRVGDAVVFEDGRRHLLLVHDAASRQYRIETRANDDRSVKPKEVVTLVKTSGVNSQNGLQAGSLTARGETGRPAMRATASAPATAPYFGRQQAKEVATGFIEAFGAGQYEEARKYFTPQMQQGMPAAKLRDARDYYQDHYGRYIGHDIPNVGSAWNVSSVSVASRWERQTITFNLDMNSVGQITQMSISESKPQAAATQGVAGSASSRPAEGRGREGGAGLPESGANAPADLEVRVAPLHNGDPEDIAKRAKKTLETRYGGLSPSFTTDYRTNSIIVAGKKAMLDDAMQIIGKMEQESSPPAQTQKVQPGAEGTTDIDIQVVRVRSGDVEETAYEAQKVLDLLYGKNSPAVEAEASSRTLYITGRKEHLDMAERVVQLLEKARVAPTDDLEVPLRVEGADGNEVRLVPMRRGDSGKIADRAQTTVDTMYGKQAPLVETYSGGRYLIAGRTEQIDKAVEMIRKLEENAPPTEKAPTTAQTRPAGRSSR